MFRDGEFEAITELPEKASSYEWDAGEPGINYYWRVVSLINGESFVSEVARAEAAICPVDERPDNIR